MFLSRHPSTNAGQQRHQSLCSPAGAMATSTLAAATIAADAAAPAEGFGVVSITLRCVAIHLLNVGDASTGADGLVVRVFARAACSSSGSGSAARQPASEQWIECLCLSGDRRSASRSGCGRAVRVQESGEGKW